MTQTEGEIETHPVQTHRFSREGARVRVEVTKAAYEVYCHVHTPQPAMMTGDCRGGFGAGELVAFLYARSFPKAEWSQRVDEALRGMTI
jgi:hypothetical protein